MRSNSSWRKQISCALSEIVLEKKSFAIESAESGKMNLLHRFQTFLKHHWLFLAACLGVAVLGALGFVGVTLAVRADLLRSLDFDLTVRIQDLTPVKLDEYLIWFGTIAKFQLIVPALILFLLIMQRWVMVVTSLGFLFVAHLLEIVGKEILFQPPPPFMFYRHPTEFVFPELHVFDVSSYPSGHSLRITFVTVTIFAVLWTSPRIPLLLKLAIGAALAGVAFLTMFSRVSLGEHWSSDVAGGFFLGLMCAALNVMFVLWKKTNARTHHAKTNSKTE